jgi:hypothetical protein
MWIDEYYKFLIKRINAAAITAIARLRNFSFYGGSVQNLLLAKPHTRKQRCNLE